MSTRLYPVTEDPAVLELLAHVPPGTAERLNALEAAYFPDGGPCDYDGLYLVLDKDPCVNRYYTFRLFGWGRISESHDALGRELNWFAPEGYWSVSKVTDVELASYLLELKGILHSVLADLRGAPLSVLGGVSWG